MEMDIEFDSDGLIDVEASTTAQKNKMEGKQRDEEGDDSDAVKFGLKSAIWLHLGKHLDSTLLSLSSNNSSTTATSATTSAYFNSETATGIGREHAEGTGSGRGGGGGGGGGGKGRAGGSEKERFNMHPHFCAALAQLVYTQIELAALDVESFARHAGRTTIQSEDVVLLARRNPDLESMLKASSPNAVTFGARDSGGGRGGGRRNDRGIGKGKGKGKQTDDEEDGNNTDSESDGPDKTRRKAQRQTSSTRGSNSRGRRGGARPVKG